MTKFLRFEDLRQRGVVGNRVTLGSWIRDYNFPAGRLLGPNTRVWTESEIEAWIESRPITLKTERERRAR